jgi:hypothetical protein
MRGRRPSASAVVARLEGPRATRERLRVLLDTLSGRIALEAAGARLGLGRTRVLALRREALQGALEALAPRPLGRPRAPGGPGSPDLRRLQARVRELELALQAALVRTEVALTMPYLLTRGAEKKGRGPRAARAPRARRPRAGGA